MPLFSTITASYNREDLIADTLDSVLAQEFSDQEIIVVDDGSTDGTLRVLERYADRITLLQQQNQGPGAARNLGMRHASGKYVAFLDSDDLWFPWTLATYKQAIDAHGSPALVSGAHHDFSDVDELRDVRREEMRVTSYADFYASPRPWLQPSASVVRTDVVRERGGFTEKIRVCEDADFWLRIGTAPGFVQFTRRRVAPTACIPPEYPRPGPSACRGSTRC